MSFDPKRPVSSIRDAARRRGIYLLPNLFTTAALFAGFYAVVAAMDGNFVQAAIAIFVAMILDGMDGRIARLTSTESDFGMEYDSLSDMVSFGLAPALVVYQWGVARLQEYGWIWGKIGWLVAFLYAVAAALRLARFNIQSSTQTDKRYFVGMPSPSAAGVVAATVYGWPERLAGPPEALAAVVVLLVPAFLMVSTVRFRAFKAVNFGWARSPMPLFLFAILIVFIFTEPRFALVVLAYGYLLSALVEWGLTRMRARRPAAPPAAPPSP